jgi:WD40 repeat protein
MEKEQYNVFLAYNDLDENEVEEIAERLANEEGIKPFFAKWDLIPGTPIQEALEQAIENSVTIAVFLSQNGFSPWQSELLYTAIDKAVKSRNESPVIPILLPYANEKDFPTFLSRRVPVDFHAGLDDEKAFQRLVDGINGLELPPPLPRVGRLFNVPSLPPHYLPREDEFNTLKSALLSEGGREHVATGKKFGLQGMGGIGKSVLAAALAQDADIRLKFPDGIVWVKLGQNPDLLSRQAQLIRAVTGKNEAFGDTEQGRTILSEALAERRCLICLDDVWSSEDIDAFSAERDRSRIMLTTRDAGLVTASGGSEHILGTLSNTQALTFLAEWVGQQVRNLPTIAEEIIKECGNLPLALAISAAMVKEGTPWEDLLEALKEADLEFFDHDQGSVMKSIAVSVNALPEEQKLRYLELGVFLSDTTIPEEALVTYWGHTGGMKARYVSRLVNILAGKSLLKVIVRDSKRGIELHSLHHDFVKARSGQPEQLHQLLLAAYREKCTNRWASAPNDGYFYQNLPYHLSKAGEKEELRGLQMDFLWLQAKLRHDHVNSIISDYDLLPKDETLSVVQSVLRIASHALIRDRTQLAAQLLGRISKDSPGIGDLLNEAERWEGSSWLRPLKASLIPPGAGLTRTLVGHSGAVNAVALTPDEKFAISGASDGTVKVWALDKWEEPRTLRGHKDKVNTVAVTPDGERAVSGSNDGTIKVWDLENGSEHFTLTGTQGHVTAVVVSPNGKHIISGSDSGGEGGLFGEDGLRVWDIEKRELFGMIPDHRGGAIYVTQDGKFYTNTGFGLASAVAVSPDLRFFMRSMRNPYSLEVWDYETGEIIYTLEHKWIVTSLAVTPDSKNVLTGCWDKTVKVWDLETGELVREFRGHSGFVQDVAMFPKSNRAISASDDGTLKIWDLESKEDLVEGHTKTVNSIAIPASGKFALTASDDYSLRIWDLDTGEELQALEGHEDRVSKVAVTPDGQYAVSAAGFPYVVSNDHTLKTWDLKKGRELYTLDDHKSPVTAVAVTPDGQYVVSAGHYENKLIVWDLKDGQKLHELSGHCGYIHSLTITPDGKKVLSASEDEDLRLWDIEKGTLIHSLAGHDGMVKPVAITSDGLLAVSADGPAFKNNYSLGGTSPILWDLEKGKAALSFHGHHGRITAVDITPDDKFVATASVDGTARIWDIQTGKELYIFTGHQGPVLNLDLSVDGQLVVTTSVDLSIKVWDLLSKSLVASFDGDHLVRACMFAPDGKTIIAGTEIGTVHILKIERIK